MADKYARQSKSLDSPADDGFAITPGPGDLPSITKFLYVGGAGNLTVQMGGPANTVLTFSSVSAGTTLRLRVVKVFANSTATALVGLV